MSKVLITGGAGYIGSHACVELVSSGYDVVVIDNLSNSSRRSLKRVEKILGVKVDFIEGDIRCKKTMRAVFKKYKISAVLHFAGLKSVNESISNPLAYYANNVSGSIALFEVMNEFECKKLIFSSSATVYGEGAKLPILESSPLSTTNAYGESKLIIENVLQGLNIADNTWSIGILRYFNPVGAHPSGLIGEDPNGQPNNLMPFISQVAVGKQKKLKVFGNGYCTPDGTGVRDYIHVVDLVKGHLCALKHVEINHGLIIVNLGTGRGYSVLEMVKAFKEISGCDVPFEIVESRPGDVATCYADTNYAQELLGWRAELGLTAMCSDAWRWQKENPNGYR